MIYNTSLMKCLFVGVQLLCAFPSECSEDNNATDVMFMPSMISALRISSGWYRFGNSGKGVYCNFHFGRSIAVSTNEVIKSVNGIKYRMQERKDVRGILFDGSGLKIFVLTRLWLDKDSRRLAKIELFSTELALKESEAQIKKIRDDIESGFLLQLIKISVPETNFIASPTNIKSSSLFEADDKMFNIRLMVYDTSDSTQKLCVSVTSKRVWAQNGINGKKGIKPFIPTEGDLQIEIENF